MKRMMINATQSEELRVAIADGQKLLDLDIETPAHEQKKANIYKARITRVERSLEACFVDYGVPRHGFLPFKEINPDALNLAAGEKKSGNIKDLLKEGQELIVQVEKEERGTKGAALSAYISLAGRYSVLMPNNPGGGGVSRRISGPERNELRDLIDQLNLPEDMGLIIRTAGMGREITELQWDIDYLVQLWEAIKNAADEHKAPLLIYQESNLFIRALRDYLRDDISEILVDDENVYNKAVEFMQMVMPHNLRKLKRYDGETPLFTRFQIESQIETAFAREVHLPSGGAVVIDRTEALLSIDINSARATKGADIEETALQTNLEAADEIARQLKIRDLGGLVVIDFIDMSKRSAQRKVEERLHEALKSDRARIQTGRISRFGLLEMSRQRMRPSLGDSSYQICPRCLGSGSIRSVESLALSILRLLEEEALKDNTGQIQVQVPVTVANFMLNEKRQAIQVIEKRHDVVVVLLSNPGMETPQYEIRRLRQNEVEDAPSYEQVKLVEPDLTSQSSSQTAVNRPQALVDRIQPSAPAPVRKTAKSGWLQSMFAFFSGHNSDGDSGSKQDSAARGQAQRDAGRQGATVGNASGKRAGGGGKKTRSKKKTGKKPQQKKSSAQQKQSPESAQKTSSGPAASGPTANGQAQDNAKSAERGNKRRGKKTSKQAAAKSDNAATASQQADQSSAQGHAATAGDGNTEHKPRRRGKRGGRRRRSRQEAAAASGNDKQQAGSQDQQANAKSDGNQGADQRHRAQRSAVAGQTTGKAATGQSAAAADKPAATAASQSTEVASEHSSASAAASTGGKSDTSATANADQRSENPAPAVTANQQSGQTETATASTDAEPKKQTEQPSKQTSSSEPDRTASKASATKALPDGPKGLYVLPAADAAESRDEEQKSS